MSQVDKNCLDRLSDLVLKHLGIKDEDQSVSKFMHSLYQQANGKPSSYKNERLEAFKKILAENGGDDFPESFIAESFETIDNFPITKVKKEEIPFIKREITELKVPELTQRQEPVVKNEDSDLNILIKKEHYDRAPNNDPPRAPLIEEGGVYKGYVSNITAYGAFIRLNYPSSFQSGLCHISQISFDGKHRIRQVEDALKQDQQVFVKVTRIEEGLATRPGRRPRQKISLSMRGIDQTTGLDKSEELAIQKQEEQTQFFEDRQTRRDISLESQRGTKRRLTSPERWEIRQLIASGVANALDYPELSGITEDPNAAFEDHTNKQDDDQEVQIEIELSNKQPEFLEGQSDSMAELKPVKIIKNPEGSMGRAALNGSNLAKNYKEEKLKQQKQKEKEEKLAKAKSAEAHDPLTHSNAITKDDSTTNNVVNDWKKSQMNKKISYGKRTNLSMKEQRESLPVFSMRKELVDSIRGNQFLVIVGETGSGKTTQIVQYLSEEGFNETKEGHKMICCTQPRRVAAASVAKRVAEEVGCELGNEVGYTIRFEDYTSSKTKIRYMTDGMLEKEALNDPYMSKYSVIMLDEAHERTIATDVLFALLKQAANKNPNLKIIVTSATLDADKFSNYFNKCPVMRIPGRTYPVEVMYTREPEMDYLASALDSVIQIHVLEPEGDILVFLTGQEEIDTSCDALFERMKALGETVPELIILPVYSSLPSEIQSRIFEPTPPNSRKVILATNIAETSITIDGIYYVVDPGFVKINAYDSKLGMDSLIVSPISQAQANQRSGRAGRTGPGKCYRLYTEQAFKTEMLPNTIPEIQRQNLSHTILMLKAMGIKDLLNFEFMDPPPINTMIIALQELYTLNALDNEGNITLLGNKMADFPMEPTLAKTLIISGEFGCSEEILTIVAMLSVQTVFYRPKDKQSLADQRKARFHHIHGDHLTLFNVYKAWTLNGYSKTWCSENFIQERSMRKAQEVRKQLVTIMKKYRHPIISCGSDLTKVRKALCAGFFKHSAKKNSQESTYKTLVEQTNVSVHPSSSLYGKNPDYVIYHTLLLTTKEYMHCVTIIEPKWLIELAPAFYQIADANEVNQRRRKDKIVPLYDKFAKNQDSWRLSAQQSAKKRALGNR